VHGKWLQWCIYNLHADLQWDHGSCSWEAQMTHVDSGQPSADGSPGSTATVPEVESLEVRTTTPAPAALLLPGRGGGTDLPLMHYAHRCLVEAGRVVQVLQSPKGDPSARDVVRLVSEAASALPGGLDDVVVLAKSGGTQAIPWAAEHGVRGIWLTPMLQSPVVRAALPKLPPGSLIVGGTADPTWDGEVAATSGLPVLQIDGADHCLEIPGDVRRSVAALTRVVNAISETLTPSARADLTPVYGLRLI
jgi:hypothetical protein